MKNAPLRMCTVCRERKDKKELLKIVKDSDGNIFIDKTGKANGRGGYICNNATCIEKCIKTKALNRCFSCEVSREIYDKIKEEHLGTK